MTGETVDRKEVLKQAFVKALPITGSYLFVSMAYGLTMQEAGLSLFWSLFTSLTVYTGAFQFVLVTFLSSGASILTIALTALFMNSRQFFYGITFVEDFKQMDAGAGKNKLIAVAVCAGLHLWKKNTLLSIIGSTAVYMILVVVCP